MEFGSTDVEATLNFELTCPLILYMGVSPVSGCFHHATLSFFKETHYRVVKLSVIQGQIDKLTHIYFSVLIYFKI